MCILCWSCISSTLILLMSWQKYHYQSHTDGGCAVLQSAPSAFFLTTGKIIFCSRDALVGILQVLHQCLFAPHDAFVLADSMRELRAWPVSCPGRFGPVSLVFVFPHAVTFGISLSLSALKIVNTSFTVRALKVPLRIPTSWTLIITQATAVHLMANLFFCSPFFLFSQLFLLEWFPSAWNTFASSFHEHQ